MLVVKVLRIKSLKKMHILDLSKKNILWYTFAFFKLAVTIRFLESSELSLVQKQKVISQ